MNLLMPMIRCVVLTLFVAVSYAGESDDLTSQDFRKDKTWMATAQIVGAGPMPGTLTQGLSFGYFADPDFVISIEAVGGRSPVIFLDFSSYRSVKYNSVGVHLKKFVNRTFYFKAGLDANRFTEDYVYYNNVDKYGIDSESLSAGIVIGNQWQISNFTIGCDWVGVSLPIASNIKSEYASDTYGKSRLEEDKSRYLKDSGIQLVRFYLGASW